MVRPALRIDVSAKDQKELRNLVSGGVQQVRMGMSVFKEDLEIRAKQAVANADSQASFFTKRLNIRVGDASAYFNILNGANWGHERATKRP